MLDTNSSPPIRILYQDEHYIAVHKPARLLVHKSMIDRHETQFLMKMVRDQIGQYVYPVHRLDKPTSGVILFALSSVAANRMGTVFEEHKVHKTYIAVVRGYTPQLLTIDYALKEKLDKLADKDARKDKPAQEATTHMQTLSQIEIPIPVGRYQQARFSLVRLIPVTGRKHQLRRHMAHIRHPILGDTTHGDGKQNGFAREHLSCSFLALSAVQLQFYHPFSQQYVNVKTQISPEIEKVFNLFDVNVQSIYSPDIVDY